MCEECGCGQPHAHDDDAHHAGHDHGGRGQHSHSVKIEIGAAALQKNDAFAAENRRFFADRKILAVNLISSPGSGKTSLLERMAGRLGASMAVIVGDVQTWRDAERIIHSGCQAHQIETGGACHLDAHSVGHAIGKLDFSNVQLCVIENVGNLVCPAAYDLGESMKIAMLSTPEGDDKVLKYPSIFSRITVLLVNKIDLAPHLDFDFDKVRRECRSLNYRCDILRISAKTGEGVDDFCDYLANKRRAAFE